MRKTKYRGWSEKRKEWFEGDFISDNQEYNRTCDKAYILPFWKTLNCPISVVPESVGQFTNLKDKDGREIYKGDITELEVEGEIRRFVVNIKTVVREVVSHPHFYDETAKVAITGVVFEWNGFELFPCVDDNGQFDNTKMVVVGNVYENPELLEVAE